MTLVGTATHKEGSTRIYDRERCVVFRRTSEAFGGLSNMAGGYPLTINGIYIRTSEALYQACRFPHLPEVQRAIISEHSPMTAKMRGKPHRKNSRPDWDEVRVKTMRWCLRVKLAQNWDRFSNLLLETRDRPIIEESRRDDFWGAKPVDKYTLVGMNVLGRLLMEVREQVLASPQKWLLRIEPLQIDDFCLYGMPIETVLGKWQRPPEERSVPEASPVISEVEHDTSQTSMFDQLLTTNETVQRDVNANSREPRPRLPKGSTYRQRIVR